MHHPILSTAEKILGLSSIWKEATYNFAFFDQVPDLDWDATYQAFLPQVIEAEDLYTYYRKLQAFTAQLKDAHSSVYLPQDIKEKITKPSVEIAYLDAQYIIQNLGTDLDLHDCLYAQVLSVDGQDISSYVKENVHPYIAASTPHTLHHWGAQDLLLGKAGTTIQLELKTLKGKTKSLQLLRQQQESTNWLVPFLKQDSSVYLKMQDHNIAHLQVNDFNSLETLKEFEQHVSQLYQASAIILDLRFNLGGNSQIATQMLKYFIDQAHIPKLQGSTRKHLPSHKALGSFLQYTSQTDWNPNETDRTLFLKYYQGRVWELEENKSIINDLEAPKIKVPMAVLTGPETASSSEDFLVSFKLLDRGKLVGSKTCGSTGSSVLFSLPGGGLARICSRKCTFPDGTEFVGYGIQPDLEVIPGKEDIMQGDLVLQKAHEHLIHEINKSS